MPDVRSVRVPYTQNEMMIGAFCKQVGLSRDTVRFYEKAKLLSPRVLANGYRVFDLVQVERAAAIRVAQALGFTLKEIRSAIGLWEKQGLSLENQVLFLKTKIREVDERLEHLKAMRAYLEQKQKWLEQGGRGIPPKLFEISHPQMKAQTLSPRHPQQPRKQRSRSG